MPHSDKLYSLQESIDNTLAGLQKYIDDVHGKCTDLSLDGLTSVHDGAVGDAIFKTSAEYIKVAPMVYADELLAAVKRLMYIAEMTLREDERNRLRRLIDLASGNVIEAKKVGAT